jgi:protocatechuate 3,4-dioxygenase beta subunit
MTLPALTLVAALVSGLQPGDAVPSWEPVHVAGPDAGTRACPVCTYGARPMVLIITKDGPEAEGFVSRVEDLVGRWRKDQLKGFVVVTGSTPARLERLAHEHRVVSSALCYPDPEREETDLRRKLKVAVRARNTILVYRHYKVTANFVDLDPKDFSLVERAVERTLGEARALSVAPPR